ncbi:MAG: hypothetical protein ABIT96_11360, partial [Ferruginibacter sp.]
NIKEPTGINQVKVTLFTHNAEAFDTLLAVDKFGHFRFDNLLFENEARVFFSDARGRNTEPDIEIETNLDSAFHPLSPLTKFFTVGTTSVSGTLPEITDSLWMKTASLLPAVVVYAASELTEEKLNKKYVHGFFNDLNARTFIPDNDPFAASSMDVIQYLNIRVPGMHLVNGFGGEPIFYWRNEAMQFYVDEMKTPGSMLYTFPMRQIALVKVYPPPFFGNMFGGGGGIAIYLKDGTQPGPGNRHNFTIHGYTPLVSSLSAEPGSF